MLARAFGGRMLGLADRSTSGRPGAKGPCEWRGGSAAPPKRPRETPAQEARRAGRRGPRARAGPSDRCPSQWCLSCAGLGRITARGVSSMVGERGGPDSRADIEGEAHRRRNAASAQAPALTPAKHPPACTRGTPARCSHSHQRTLCQASKDPPGAPRRARPQATRR